MNLDDGRIYKGGEIWNERLNSHGHIGFKVEAVKK